MAESIVLSSKPRAAEVREQINQVKTNLVDNLLYLGELLSEIKREDYALEWGYEGFREWLADSGLDLGERQAYYLVRIVDQAQLLGIPRDDLRRSKISKLKEIFALNPVEHGAEIQQLVKDSAELSLDEVRAKVQDVRVEHGGERFTFRNFRVSEMVAEQVIDPAIERAKREYGDSVNPETGEAGDISDGRALELVCADFLANPDAILAEIEAIPNERDSSLP